jgi:hypothetical protein
VVHQGNQIGDVMRQRQGRIQAWMVGVAGTHPIRHDGTIAGRRQWLQKITV